MDSKQERLMAGLVKFYKLQRAKDVRQQARSILEDTRTAGENDGFNMPARPGEFIIVHKKEPMGPSRLESKQHSVTSMNLLSSHRFFQAQKHAKSTTRLEHRSDRQSRQGRYGNGSQ